MKSTRLPNRSRHRARLQVQQLESRNLLAGDICHNFVEAGDVNLDSNVSPLDAVLLINRLSRESISQNGTALQNTAGLAGTEQLVDVDNNGSLSVNDVLQVVNVLAEDETGDEHIVEGLTTLATAILTEDLPSGMRPHTAHAWFAKIHQKLETPLLRRDAFDHLDQNADGELTQDELSEEHWDRLSDADADETGAVTKDEVKAARRSERMLALLPVATQPHFENLDVNQDGLLSEREVTEKLWHRIISADVNQDARVSLNEIDELRQQRDAEQEGTQTQDLFGRFDVNDDGLLTEDEVDGRTWDRIVAADHNHDGTISLNELQGMQNPQVIVCDAPVLDRLFAQFDENGDGLLTEGEIGGGFWTWISQADTNQDNAVSMMELEVTADEWGMTSPNVMLETFIDQLETSQTFALAETDLDESLWKIVVEADQNLDHVVTLDEIFAELKDGEQLGLEEGLLLFANTALLNSELLNSELLNSAMLNSAMLNPELGPILEMIGKEIPDGFLPQLVPAVLAELS